MKKKKKKLSLKKIKKAFKELWENIKSIPTKIKIVIGIWILVLIVIIVLIIVGSSNKRFIEEYRAIERNMDRAMLNYVNSNEYYGTVDVPIKMPVELLVQYGVDESLINKHDCTGFSVAYYNEETGSNTISSYISCKDYVTKGYSDNNK